MNKLLVILTFVFFANYFLSNKTAFACKCVERSMNESFQESDAVFKGEVVGIEKIAFSENKQRIIFEVDEAWKGVKQSQVELVMEQTSCSVDFSKGNEYVVFAYELEGNLETALCRPTKEAADSSAELVFLGKGQTEFKEVNLNDRVKSQYITVLYGAILLAFTIIVVVIYKKKK